MRFLASFVLTLSLLFVACPAARAAVAPHEFAQLLLELGTSPPDAAWLPKAILREDGGFMCRTPASGLPALPLSFARIAQEVAGTSENCRFDLALYHNYTTRWMPFLASLRQVGQEEYALSLANATLSEVAAGLALRPVDRELYEATAIFEAQARLVAASQVDTWSEKSSLLLQLLPNFDAWECKHMQELPSLLAASGTSRSAVLSLWTDVADWVASEAPSATTSVQLSVLLQCFAGALGFGAAVRISKEAPGSVASATLFDDATAAIQKVRSRLTGAGHPSFSCVDVFFGWLSSLTDDATATAASAPLLFIDCVALHDFTSPQLSVDFVATAPQIEFRGSLRRYTFAVPPEVTSPLRLELFDTSDGEPLITENHGINLAASWIHLAPKNASTLVVNNPYCTGPPAVPLISTETCPAGTYRLRDLSSGAWLCQDCTNCPPGYHYCPGDNYRYLCHNKPLDGAEYVAQGLRWASSLCPFLCTVASQYRSNQSCLEAPVGTYPVGGSSVLLQCGVPFDLANTYLQFTSGGLRNDPLSCSFALVQRGGSVSGFGDDLLASLVHCEAGTAGYAITVLLDLNTTGMVTALLSSTNASRGFEILAIEQKWSLALIGHRTVSTNIKVQLIFTSPANVTFFSGNFTVPVTHHVGLSNLSVSVDHRSACVAFFLNGTLLGKPRPFVPSSEECAPSKLRLTIGGDFAHATHNTVYYYSSDGSYNRVPGGFSFAPVWLHGFSVTPSPIPGYRWEPLDPTPSVAEILEDIQASAPPLCSWGSFLDGKTGTCVLCPLGTLGSSAPRESEKDCECLPSRGRDPTTGLCYSLLSAFGPPTVQVFEGTTFAAGSIVLNASVGIASFPRDASTYSAELQFDVSCTDPGTVVEPVASGFLAAQLRVVSAELPRGDRCTVGIFVAQHGRIGGKVVVIPFIAWPSARALLIASVEPVNSSVLPEPFEITVRDYLLHEFLTLLRFQTNSSLMSLAQAALDHAVLVYAFGAREGELSPTADAVFTGAIVMTCTSVCPVSFQVHAPGFLLPSPILTVWYFGSYDERRRVNAETPTPEPKSAARTLSKTGIVLLATAMLVASLVGVGVLLYLRRRDAAQLDEDAQAPGQDVDMSDAVTVYPASTAYPPTSYYASSRAYHGSTNGSTAHAIDSHTFRGSSPARSRSAARGHANPYFTPSVVRRPESASRQYSSPARVSLRGHRAAEVSSPSPVPRASSQRRPQSIERSSTPRHGSRDLRVVSRSPFRMAEVG